MLNKFLIHYNSHRQVQLAYSQNRGGGRKWIVSFTQIKLVAIALKINFDSHMQSSGALNALSIDHRFFLF